jgi:hypothetical protein
MKLKRNLVTGLIGLALLAAPITAAARDNDSGRNNPRQAQSQSHDNAPAAHSNRAPERSNDHARNFAPAPAPRIESRDQRSFRAENRAPAVVEHRDARQDRNDGDRWNRDRDRDYRNYGHRDDDDNYAEGAPYYVMPYGYAGGACAWARHLRNVYYYDRNTGHPAAAAYLIPQLRRAEQNCGGVPYGYNDYGYSW